MRLVRILSVICLNSLALAASHPNWQELRQQLENTFHIPQPLPALDANSYGRFSPASGVSADRVSYTTGYGLRVPAIQHDNLIAPDDMARRMAGLMITDLTSSPA